MPTEEPHVHKASSESLFRGSFLSRSCRHHGGQAYESFQVVTEPDKLMQKFMHLCKMQFSREKIGYL